MFVDELKQLLGECHDLTENTVTITDEYLESGIWWLDEASCTLKLIKDQMSMMIIVNIEGNDEHAMTNDQAILDALIVCLETTCELKYVISNYIQSPITDRHPRYFVTSCQHMEGHGKPAFTIEKEQIEFLRELHFTWSSIARLGVSMSTLWRQRLTLNISEQVTKWSTISDDQLESVVQDIRNMTPNIGERRLMGALRSQGFQIQRCRLQKCLRNVDLLGTALRWRPVICRCKYNAPTPNALWWHIDGNHKLICWKLVVQCCVDGYSHVIIYTHCADNHADTVLQFISTGC